ncbi:MAG: transposase [Cyanobacteriota bacterium]
MDGTTIRYGRCGIVTLQPIRGTAVVPSASTYSRFLARLMKEPYLSRVKQLFQTLVKNWYQESPDFGQQLGIDGKALSSYAVKEGAKGGDRRGEHDADWGIHEQFHQNTAGERIHRVKKWFGFTLHLVADTTYELPIGYTRTKASCSEQPVARTLIDELFEKDREKRERARHLCADRGYDSTETIVKL